MVNGFQEAESWSFQVGYWLRPKLAERHFQRCPKQLHGTKHDSLSREQEEGHG